MKKTNLICKSTNCVHNKNGDCMAGVINIRGLYATTSSKTSCSTFFVEGGYSFDNLSSYHDNKVTKTDKIRCNASNCRHNNAGECYADSVEIMAANASCKTFECLL